MCVDSQMKKIGGNNLSINKLNDLIDCCGLSDLRSVCSSWSWHNNTHENARIYGKLDRATCNDNWLHLLPESFVEYKGTSSSEHISLLLYMLSLLNSGPKQFKIFNYSRVS